MFSELERLLLKPGTLPPCSPVCASGTRTRGSCRPPSRGRGPGPSSAGSRCPGSPCSRGVCGHRSRGTWRGGSGPRGGGRRPGAPATARVSVPRRPLTPRKPGLKTRPGLEPGASPRAVLRLALPQPKNLPFWPPSSQFRLPTLRWPLQASLIWCRVHFYRGSRGDLGQFEVPVASMKLTTSFQMKRYVSILVHGGDGPPPPPVSRKLLTPSSRVF